MAEGLAKKKRVRGGHRTSVKKTLTQVEALLEEEPDVPKLSAFKMALSEKVKTLNTLDDEIANLLEDEGDLADDIGQADEYKQKIYSVIVSIERAIAPIPPAGPVLALRRDPSRDDPFPTDAASRVKLPKLTLRSFDGDITKWTSFWDSYKSAVHDNRSLSEVDKFNYLRSLVERSAREAISGLSLTDANYAQAIEILQRRFGSKQQIISKHMDILLNLDPVISASVKSLRQLYDRVEANIRGLKSLGVDSKTYGSLLSPVLLSKLPPDIRLLVSRDITEDNWTLDALLERVEREVAARERAGTNHVRNPEGSTPTASTLINPSFPTCCYCQQGHASTSCKSVTDIEERRKILKRTGRCYICLRRGHVSRNCRATTKCHKCKGRHHSSICPPEVPKDPTHKDPLPTSSTPQQGVSAGSGLNPDAPTFPSSSMLTVANQSVLLQTALTSVYDPGRPHEMKKVRLILDNGSQHSYISCRIKESLRLIAEDECQLAIAAFGSKRSGPQVCEVVRVRLKARYGPDPELTLLTVPYICEPLSVQPISLCQERYSHLSHLELADNSDESTRVEVDILIGSDHYWQLMTGGMRRGEEGPVALHSRFGWVLSGPVAFTRQDLSMVNLLTTHILQANAEPDDMKKLDKCLHSFWSLESLGVSVDNEEYPLLEEFSHKICFEGGRYEVSLPWREDHAPLPTNYGLAAKRLEGLRRRLRHNPTVLCEYDAIIRDQLKRGIVQLVEPQRHESGKKLHYLPHHPVVRRDKETTKVRIVYDASARSTGPSLNDCLHTGPKFNQKILDTLLRFRVHKVPLTADIEKAYLMIAVSEPDRDVLRFLWFEDVFRDEPTVVKMRFARVVFGVSASPFLLNATVQHHLKGFLTTHPETVASILQSIYVDDIAFGAEDEESTYRLYQESKEIMKKGSFNLRKFTTSHPLLQARIDIAEGTEAHSQSEGVLDETFAKTTLGGAPLSKKSEQKILGVCWDTLSDCLVFNLCELTGVAEGLEPTKRNIVSMVGRFYDPIGILSPVIVSFKVLIQEICESHVDWDQPLDEPQAEKWQELVNGLKKAEPILITRGYFNSVITQVKSCCLYGFCDASKKAYAAVIYLVAQTSTQTHVQFVVSKTRVAPMRSQTIPRLELLSALLLARLMSTTMNVLSSCLKLDLPRQYTDSQVVLYWICGQGRQWRPFVQNRVNEICKLTRKSAWGHCPGKENPADLLSRGLTPLELSTSALWRRGPPWMMEGGEPPSTANSNDMPKGCTLELKMSGKTMSHNLMNPSPTGVGVIMKCQDFSSLVRLYRVMTFIVKFVRKLVKVRDRNSNLPDSEEAERLWIVEAQSAITQDKDFGTWKKQFNLFLDSYGIWRCGGRLNEVNLSYSSKHPVLLSRNHPLTALIVQNAHERVGHNGVRDTLTEIRSRYWILKGRSIVRSIIARCVLCKKFEGRPFTAPLPPPLPKFRVQESRPFSHTAIDFAGPLHVKTFGVVESEKMWICLYTCCATRAVHIDIVPDMSTDTFVRCLRRFCARRGTPQVIVSDNAKTFKAAAIIIQDVIGHPEVQKYCSDLSFKWHFNLEKAPWWGGMFERLIKSTKRCLRKMIGQAHFTHDELLTVVVEIEAIINARPLSYLSSDDEEEPLTPSHLLCGRRLLSLPEHLSRCHPTDDEDFEIVATEAARRVKHLHNVLNHFWRRWRREYLVELRECHRYSRGRESASSIEPGDIVLVHDDNLPRSFWKLARVLELIIGHDGKTRGAIVRVPDKSGKTTTLRRPLQRLYPLELKCKEPAEPRVETTGNREKTTEQQEDPKNQKARLPRRQPQRRAAAEARDLLDAYMVDIDSDGD